MKKLKIKNGIYILKIKDADLIKIENGKTKNKQK